MYYVNIENARSIRTIKCASKREALFYFTSYKYREGTLSCQVWDEDSKIIKVYYHDRQTA